ncbi:TPA: hypothetical protein ACGO30_001737 [Streptococcus suis]
MIHYYKLNSNDLSKIKKIERRLSELERQLERPDLHPYRNCIQNELDDLEKYYFYTLQYLGAISNHSIKEVKI